MLNIFNNPLFKYYGVFDGNKIAQFTATAPSPHKDFYHLLITQTKFIWRWWRITSRNEAAKFSPGEVIASFPEFLCDDNMKDEIKRILGSATLEFCLNIANGHFDLLPRMPSTVIKRIICFLQLEDVVNLECTCKRMAEQCNVKDIWEMFYHIYHPGETSETVIELANIFGWKRVFFTSKLKLQVQIRRLQMDRDSGAGDVDSNSLLADSTNNESSSSQLINPDHSFF